ncbi:MAG: hypothetical protein JO068_00860 [Hyphomicrobiales bacterium]|nr:hypothetical protein [Hyphomicrobiales bacterium]
MTSVDRPAKRIPKAHPEEWPSIIAALVGAGATTLFLWSDPGFRPSADLAWAIPGWVALAYLFIQIVCVLVSTNQLRALGILDAVVAIVPVTAAIVTGVEWMLGRLPLSSYQVNVLATMLVVGFGEFLLTIWVRLALNRRSVSVEPSEVITRG